MATEMGLLSVVLALATLLTLGLLTGFWLARRMNAGQSELVSERAL